MAITPVYRVVPVYPIASLLSQGGAAAVPGAGPGAVVNPPSSTNDPTFVTFKKLRYDTGLHGGPVPVVAASVTLPATVTVSGTPRREAASGSELRDRARTTLKVVTSEDPAVYLGAPLATDDLIDWAGFQAFVIGTALPQGTSFNIVGELMF